jgi:hypothetical protein
VGKADFFINANKNAPDAQPSLNAGSTGTAPGIILIILITKIMPRSGFR